MERTTEIEGLPYQWREAPSELAVPAVYVHGVPTSSWDFTPFLERTGGFAPDLPGFGRSAKRGDLDYTPEGLATFLERWLERAQVPERFSLVVHDWGAVGLILAQRHPERIARLVVIDAVPLLDGYRWHAIARVCRTPGLGELFMGLVSLTTIRLLLRAANVTKGSLPEPLLVRIAADFDPGTQRAILRLYRAGAPATLARLGERLGSLDAPALVLWGARDPYLPSRWAGAYAQALGAGAEVRILPDAGHWPWWEDGSDVVEQVRAFLAEAR